MCLNLFLKGSHDAEPAKDIAPSASPTPQPYRRLSEGRPSSAGPAKMGASPVSSQIYKVMQNSPGRLRINKSQSPHYTGST